MLERITKYELIAPAFDPWRLALQELTSLLASWPTPILSSPCALLMILLSDLCPWSNST